MMNSPPGIASLADDIVHGLSRLINESLHSHEAERHYPSNNADAMDAKIAFTGTRVEVLRRLRTEFENEMARPLRRDGE